MRQILCATLLALALTGCANTPPACDGSQRRPVNLPAQAGAAERMHPSCSAQALL